MSPQERQVWVRSMGARTEWWARRQEAVVAPDWEVVDAHVHLWDARQVPDPQDAGASLQTSRYLWDEYMHDARSGHKVVQCVYVECGTAYDPDGPVNLRPVGETAFVAGLAGQLATGQAATGQAATGRAATGRGGPEIAAIVAHADLRDPALDAVLDAHGRAGGGLVRSIRHSAARLEDPAARLLAGAAPPGLYADPDFRRGVARLGGHGLTFDAFQFHFQVDDLAALARAVPETTIVVNHLGAPIGFSHVPAGEDPVFAVWARGVERLAALPNVVMKLGGLASVVTGYDGCERDRPPASAEFVAERGAYFHHAIRCLGPERCMFESNFPVDSVSISYGILWNAFKTMAMDYGAAARRDLLAGTARRIYRL